MRGPQVTTNVQRAFAEALSHFEAGRTAEARMLCRRIAAAQGDFGGAHYLLGLIELRAGAPRKARAPLEKAVALSPNAQAPRLALARALAGAGKREAAIAEYGRALVLGPAAEGEAELAELLRLTGRPDEAMLHYRAALALKPELPQALNDLGALLVDAGHADEAEPLLARAVELRPDWASALNNRGVALLALRRPGEAALHFARAADARPAFAAAHRNLADALHQLCRLDEAEAAARTAVRLDSKDARAWLALALVQKARGGDPGEALDKALRLDDGLAQAHVLRGETALAAGDRATAEKHFRRTVALDPQDQFGALLQLAVIAGEPAPSRAPDAYVTRLFDQYAARFDAALLDDLGYRGPALLRQAVKEVMGDAGGWTILDAGCGTGLVGAVFRPLAARLDGIDLSPRMIDKAAERGIYDDLTVGDLVVELSTRPARYDLIVAGDVFVYLGDLTAAFHTAASALKPGGGLAFSVERAASGIVLGPHLRYAHGADALRATAFQAGLTVALLCEDWTRLEGGQPVPGWVCVMRKE